MNKYWLVVLTFLFIAFYSCSKDKLEEELAAENQKLAAHMLRIDFPGADTISDYIYVKINAPYTEGVKPKAGEYVLVNMKIKQYYDNILEYDSNYNGMYLKGGPEVMQLTAPLWGIFKGISMMREGETAEIVLPSYYYTQDLITRLFQIELVKVISDIDSYQESLMKWYMTEHKKFEQIDTIEMLVDGKNHKVLYHIVDEIDSTKLITETTPVKLSWTGWYSLLTNKLNQYHKTTEAQSFTSVSEVNTSIRNVLLKMDKGGKVIITMPYRLFVFDGKMNFNTTQPFDVPPEYPVLMFEMKVE